MVADPAVLREKGDWIARLRVILDQPAAAVGARPQAEHRSSAKAARVLLTNLRAGAVGKTGLASEDDIRKVVFNAVDLLVDDKVGESTKNKTRLQAIDKVRDALRKELAADAQQDQPLDKAWRARIEESLRAIRQEEVERLYLQGGHGAQAMETLRRDMLATDEGRAALVAKPALGQDVLAKVDAQWLNDSRNGPRICQTLWKTGDHDAIVALLARGVDTSRAAPANGGEGKRGDGVYSNFVQPVEHILSTHLQDVARLDAGDPTLQGEALTKAKGAKKILAALEKKGVAVTLTRWKDVQDSEMIDAFQKKPGTIWGFEDVRLPYVQAAHGTAQGAQPLRMMELWETVEEALGNFGYEDLLKDPPKYIAKFVAAGETKVKDGIKAGEPKYLAIAAQKDTFLANFRKAATAFLTEMVAQMPKGGAIDFALGDNGKRRIAEGVQLSGIAGVGASKLMAGMACKAGLWWAKSAGDPVYYCLDGIDMDDVINYKALKNKAIEDFLANGGRSAGAKVHDEVITMVEVREILKNWDDLKDTVVFVHKGRVLPPDEAATKVAGWHKAMLDANKKAGRPPAPPRAEFAHNLAAIDPGLMRRLPKGASGDQDARDIVRKASYLTKVARTRPHVLLKYLMSRCEVLLRYGLVDAKLPAAAAALFAPAEDADLAALAKALRQAIDRCHASFQKPLKAGLAAHPAFQA